MNSITEESSAETVETPKQATKNSFAGIETAVLTGCQDRHYAFGVAMALASKGATVDVIGSDEIDSPELHTLLNLRFFNFRSDQSKNPTFKQKLWGIFLYYVNLARYAAYCKPQILHIL